VTSWRRAANSRASKRSGIALWGSWRWSATVKGTSGGRGKGKRRRERREVKRKTTSRRPAFGEGRRGCATSRSHAYLPPPTGSRRRQLQVCTPTNNVVCLPPIVVHFLLPTCLTDLRQTTFSVIIPYCVLHIPNSDSKIPDGSWGLVDPLHPLYSMGVPVSSLSSRSDNSNRRRSSPSMISMVK